MNGDTMIQGGCLCGAVRFRATPAEAGKFGVCHCGMCRRWAGGPFMVVKADSAPAIEGEADLMRYRSSEWGERVSCRKCGAPLFMHILPSNDHFLAFGALDAQNGYEMEGQIFIDRKPDSYRFDADTPAMTEAEFFALYAPKT